MSGNEASRIGFVTAWVGIVAGARGCARCAIHLNSMRP